MLTPKQLPQQHISMLHKKDRGKRLIMKKYFEPYFEVVNLSNVDVVCTSGEYGAYVPGDEGIDQD